MSDVERAVLTGAAGMTGAYALDRLGVIDARKLVPGKPVARETPVRTESQQVDSQKFTIMLASPGGSITNVDAPNNALKDAPVVVSVTYKNTMDTTATFHLELYEIARGTPSKIGESTQKQLNSGEKTTQDFNFQMPGHDMALEVRQIFDKLL